MDKLSGWDRRQFLSAVAVGIATMRSGMSHSVELVAPISTLRQASESGRGTTPSVSIP